MGRGGDGAVLDSPGRLEKIKAFGSTVKGDLKVLKNIWFSRSRGDNHADRLEQFYAPQADAYDQFRKDFLWGREPLLAACAARLRGLDDVVWVDLGGGTGENVRLMDAYFPVAQFRQVYVVDLCRSLCAQAQQKVKQYKWKNVQVMEADATKFSLPKKEKATLVTFSYSLSMIPPFHEAVDRAVSYLDDGGILGVCDFFVSAKYDLPLRQMCWARRFFWRSVFDMDNIDIGPERRAYLDCKLDREWEYNAQGPIPYVPYLRAPWYVWIGRKQRSCARSIVRRAQAPAMFPPTFLYTMSWEDPDTDAKVLDINRKDVCLTLTSGGCNSLNLLLHGAKEVYSVDCNPAQTALLELKCTAIKNLDYDQVWKMFGEGKFGDIEPVYKKHLAPFMTQNSIDFWNKKLYHFKKGLYYAGGMGKVCWMVQYLVYLTNFTEPTKAILNANSLEVMLKFGAATENDCVPRSNGPRWVIKAVIDVTDNLLFNRFFLWFGGGVPSKQSELIGKDGFKIPTYLTRTVDGVARYSHLKNENYFYYNCLTGHYLKENCPAYLKEENFAKLNAGLVDQLHVLNGKFNEELAHRQYSKVILMDHVDWLDEKQALEVIQLLSKQVVRGGRIIFRSAALCPPYVKMLKENGFHVTCVKRADQGGYFMDRVNMYNSFYMGIKM